MNFNNVGIPTQTLLVAAALACTLFAGNLVAKDSMVTVAIHVSAQGLKLSQPAGARQFYARLENAAWVVCARPKRVGLVPVDDPMRCAEKSLAAAIRSTNLPTLTHIYLETHTLQQAAAFGINIPLQAAAR
jgi:UrcA family protein